MFRFQLGFELRLGSPYHSVQALQCECKHFDAYVSACPKCKKLVKIGAKSSQKLVPKWAKNGVNFLLLYFLMRIFSYLMRISKYRRMANPIKPRLKTEHSTEELKLYWGLKTKQVNIPWCWRDMKMQDPSGAETLEIENSSTCCNTQTLDLNFHIWHWTHRLKSNWTGLSG